MSFWSRAKAWLPLRSYGSIWDVVAQPDLLEGGRKLGHKRIELLRVVGLGYLACSGFPMMEWNADLLVGETSMTIEELAGKPLGGVCFDFSNERAGQACRPKTAL